MNFVRTKKTYYTILDSPFKLFDLIGHVEEGEEVALLDDGAHLFPLLRAWVNT